jgi:hypothetical protein
VELAVRFLVGGVVVSIFAIGGDVLKPKSFAGLLGAAPSVALATITLAVMKEGKPYAAAEARSMILGAVAFALYASLVSRLLMRRRWSALSVTAWLLPLWLGAALGLWRLLLG